MKTSNEPQARYNTLATEADVLIDHLRDRLKNHALGEASDWEHVGDLGHVVAMLRGLVEFLDSDDDG